MPENKIHLWIIILGFNTFLLPSGILPQTVTINSAGNGSFRNAASWDTAFYPGGPGSTTADMYQVNIGNNSIIFQPDSFYTGMVPPQTPPSLPTTTTSTDVLNIRLIGTSGGLQISRNISIEHIEILTDTTQFTVDSSNRLMVDRLVFADGISLFNGNLFVRYRPNTAYSVAINPLFNIQAGATATFNGDINFMNGIELDIDSTASIFGQS